MAAGPVITKPPRSAAPHLRKFTAEVFANLARKTKYVDPGLASVWPAIVGPEIARLCRPGKLSGGRSSRTLELIASNGSAAARVQFEAAAIRRKVNDHLGPDVVGHISVRQSALREADPRLQGALARFRAAIAERKRD